MFFLYPEGKKKALTFSYDDGEIFDIVELIHKLWQFNNICFNSIMNIF